MQALLQEMLNSETGVPIRSQRHRLTVIPSVFTGNSCTVADTHEGSWKGAGYESPLHPTRAKRAGSLRDWQCVHMICVHSLPTQHPFSRSWLVMRQLCTATGVVLLYTYLRAVVTLTGYSLRRIASLAVCLCFLEQVQT